MPKANSPIVADFSAMDGAIVSFDPDTRKYRVRVNSRKLSIVEAVQLETPGFEAPFAVDDMVILQRIPPSGVWVILGRIQKPRAKSSEKVTYRQPGDQTEAALFTSDGDFAVKPSSTVEIFLSRAGAFAARVAALCTLALSKTSNLIKMTCQTLVVEMPKMVLRASVADQTLETSAGIEMTTAGNNQLKLQLGGLVADNSDGLSLALGSLMKLLIQLLPGDTQLTLTQNTTKVVISTAEFLQQFGDGQARWTNTGLTVSKGATTITVAPESLGITAQAATLNLSALTANVTGTITLSAAQLIQQNYYWLTVVQRLNQLLLVFSTHTHQAGPIQTSTPTGSPVNEKGTPIGMPVLPAEQPLPI